MNARLETVPPTNDVETRTIHIRQARTGLSFPAWPQCSEDECEAAMRVLRSGKLNYWTGSEGREFEREFAEYVGCRHAVAVANGTVALELALGALGIGPGDEVIVPSRTFVATAFAVSRCGATPVFADIDSDSQNMTADSIRDRLSHRTRAVIAVHLAGWPCEMEPIIDLARRRKIWVVEDCAQAHGARYKGCAVGSFGDAAAYSFCQDKIITTAGEGGMLVTNNRDVWQRAWSFKDHGKNYEAAHQPAPSAAFRWLHESVGTNWRLTEVQSAIGRVALRRLDSWVSARRRNAAILNESFSSIASMRTTPPPADAFHSYYKYYAFVRPDKLAAGWTRDRLIAEINRAGVPCFSGTCSEVYLEKSFGPSVRPHVRLPVARESGDTSLMFLVHPTLEEPHMRQIAKVAMRIMRAATNDLSLNPRLTAA